ncbi:MAG TPA: cytochrome c, partial [Ilumatobacteraceae bacterium]|nr:cytochrome c [Ilumatobacteraceae bacterium]
MTKLEILSIAVLTGAIAAALPASAAQTSSVDGWYAPDQATRGKGSYNANCAVCHGSSLQGGAGPALSGASFAAKWRDRPLRDLYTVAHDQMPLTAPGKLPPKTSFDILAYLLSFNGFQASTKAVSASDLDRALTPPQTGKNI